MFARWTADGAWADVVDLLRAGVRAGGGPGPRAVGRRHRLAVGARVRRGRGPGRDQRFRPVEEGQRPQAAPHGGHAGAADGGRGTAASTQDRAGAVALLLRPPRRRGPVPAGPRLGRQRLPRRLAGLGPPGTRHRHRGRRAAPGQDGFRVLPRRWVVERTNAWITRRRRCARDYERLPERHAAWSRSPPSSR